MGRSKSDSESERVARWWARKDAAHGVYEEQRVFWDRLEDALSGSFPVLIPSKDGSVDGRLRLRGNDQIDLNLLLRAKRIFEATAYDEFPSLRFSREPEAEEEVVLAAERLIEKLMDEGGAVYESKAGMSSSMTRGSSIVWVDVERPQVSPLELQAKKIPPADFVQAALAEGQRHHEAMLQQQAQQQPPADVPTPGDTPDTATGTTSGPPPGGMQVNLTQNYGIGRMGMPQVTQMEQVKIPLGADYQAINEAAMGVLTTPEVALGLNPSQEQAVKDLATQAGTKYQEELDGVHSLDRRAKVKFEATPYGSWCLFDASVTDRRRMGHVFRKHVFTPEEFGEEALFKKSVRDEVLERYRDAIEFNDAQVPGKTKPNSTRPAIDEADRVVVWCVYDKVNWKRHYLCEMVKDKFLEVSDEFPYVNENGQPIFPDFWPCVIRTPLEHNKEVAWRTLGIPVLEPGWCMQVEFIKARSAWVIACKKSGRTGTIANGVDDAAVRLLEQGVDGTWVKPGANYDKQKDGEVMTPLNWGNAPEDYLLASKQSMADFANAVGISLASMTGEAMADTLGQEQIAMSGANITSMDMVKCYESGYAEEAMKAFLLFRANASDEEFSAYLGPGASQPRMDALGQPKPSLIQAIKAAALDGCKLVARFASSTRAEDAVTIKQMDDFVALILTARDGTGTPFFNPKPLLERAAKLRDIQGLRPYEPSPMEMQMKLAAMQQAAATGKPPDGASGPPGGGASDGRKAGGQRGPPAVPGRQSRHQQPMTNAHHAGLAARPHGAVA